MKRRVPNILTIARVLLACGFIYFVRKPDVSSVVVAIVFFTFASLTDYFDGYFAKKHDFISNFGKIADPIADKFLSLAAFYVFVEMQMMAAWMFYVIFFREVFVTIFRFVAIRKGVVLAAERAGKLKTVFQITTISVMLVFLLFFERIWSLQIADLIGPFVMGALQIITVALTLYSGISTIWNNRKVFVT